VRGTEKEIAGVDLCFLPVAAEYQKLLASRLKEQRDSKSENLEKKRASHVC
jgi:hypothetical protein